MAFTQLSEIKTLVRASVKEALRAELMKLRALLMSAVSDAEQADIERRYRRPSRKAVTSHAIDL